MTQVVNRPHRPFATYAPTGTRYMLLQASPFTRTEDPQPGRLWHTGLRIDLDGNIYDGHTVFMVADRLILDPQVEPPCEGECGQPICGQADDRTTASGDPATDVCCNCLRERPLTDLEVVADDGDEEAGPIRSCRTGCWDPHRIEVSVRIPPSVSMREIEEAIVGCLGKLNVQLDAIGITRERPE